MHNAVTHHISYVENEIMSIYSPVSRKIFFRNYSQSEEERLAIKRGDSPPHSHETPPEIL